MKISSLVVQNYRCLRNVPIDLGDLTVFIGANASGKSTILDALRLLAEAVQMRDFSTPIANRGGLLELTWKGQGSGAINMSAATVPEQDRGFIWYAQLNALSGSTPYVYEQVRMISPNKPPSEILNASNGLGWWWSGSEKNVVDLKQPQANCALASASVDASFPAREVAEFVGRWGFFDPSPLILRNDWSTTGLGSFDTHGRNLGKTLHDLSMSSPDVLEKIVSATRSVVGIPTKIEVKQFEDRFYFTQEEPGLISPVNQWGVSSGTLRILALMTALYGQPSGSLIGIEEPENYVHPAALSSFVEHLLDARERVQIILTTHSPLLLDFLDDPSAVNVVRRDEHMGTVITREENPEGVRKALDASGFGLGEYHESRGFGG